VGAHADARDVIVGDVEQSQRSRNRSIPRESNQAADRCISAARSIIGELVAPTHHHAARCDDPHSLPKIVEHASTFLLGQQACGDTRSDVTPADVCAPSTGHKVSQQPSSTQVGSSIQYDQQKAQPDHSLGENDD
jgi:hypothetical protein